MQLCEDIGLVVRDSPLAKLALLVDEDWGEMSRARIRGLIDVAGTIAGEEPALTLRPPGSWPDRTGTWCQPGSRTGPPSEGKLGAAVARTTTASPTASSTSSSRPLRKVIPPLATRAAGTEPKASGRSRPTG
jgi:hypothetical protein